MKIEFSGALSGEALKHVHTAYRANMKTACLLIFSCGWLITAYGSYDLLRMFFEISLYIYMPLASVFWAVIAFLPLLSSSLLKKMYAQNLPQRITFENGMVEAATSKGTIRKKLSSITEVTDHGAFYLMQFSFDGSKNVWFADKEQQKLRRTFICQKSLLTVGTIKEFEALFVGKLKQADEK